MTETNSHAAPSSGSAASAQLAEKLGLAVAGLIVVAAVTGLLGHLEGWQRLAKPVDSWPRLRTMPASALLAMGIALYGFLSSHRALAGWAAGVGAAIGFAGLLVQLGILPASADRMAMTAAVMIMTGSGAILLISMLEHPSTQDLYIGIAGCVLVSLAGTFVVARIAGVVDPLADSAVAGAALQTLIACFLLGAWFLVVVWSRGQIASAPWLAGAVGLASMITVLILWRALSVKEGEQVMTLARQTGSAERATLLRDIEVTGRSLQRAAQWRLNGASAEQQDAALAALMRDVPGLEYGLWLQVGDTARAAPFVTGLDSAWHEYVRRTGTLPDSLAFLPLDLTARRFLIVAPGCANGSCAGAMVGVVRASQLFQSVLTDTTRGFHF
ncbi:MAG: hypothetical protein ABI742_09160, partial [Gemmatimonadota bacterium]